MGIGWEAYHTGGPPWICREYFLENLRTTVSILGHLLQVNNTHTGWRWYFDVFFEPHGSHSVCLFLKKRLASQHHCRFFLAHIQHLLGAFMIPPTVEEFLQQSRNHLQQSNKNHEWFEMIFSIKSLFFYMFLQIFRRRHFWRKTWGKWEWSLSGWWFQTFFIFTPSSGRCLIWLMFFKWVETTNQL